MYIRTKDGVYNTIHFTPKMLEHYKNDIISQSENLFELFDEFVVIRDDTKINQLVRTDNINYLKEMMNDDKRIVAVKGAICDNNYKKYKTCYDCPLQIGEDSCFKYLDLNKEIEVEK